MEETPPIMKLFTDLMIFEVFMRLPTKDIMYSKMACKSWYKLLSSPKFTEYYTRYSPFTTTLWLHVSENPPGIIAANPLAGNAFFLLEVTEGGDYYRTYIKPKSPEFYKTGLALFVDSCNGLLFLWLKKHKKIKVSLMVEYKPGYIPSTDTYKLLRVVYYSLHHLVIKEANILTVGKDLKWRKVDDPLKHWIRTSNRGVSFKGSYHWIGKDDGIYTFDFVEEKCGRISKPPGLGMKLRVLKDHLCLIDSSDLNRLIIWTMKEYPVAKSWSKNVQLTCRFDLLPITILGKKSGVQISQMDSNELVSFSPDENMIEIGLGLWTTNWYDIYALTSYTPRFCPFKEEDITSLQPIKRNFWSKYLPNICLFKDSRRGKHHLERKGIPCTRPKFYPNLH
ncbi:hypothetical protein BUALT_Bualt10G0097500 [Buddleja alternifolia]|uniref:F-box protein n=1 Tax=Buddleja alternifolia TaxID=168488 RepID=A0AAV6X8A0_9LAMI|nr:hypothetical protein BUALT_Bualt10G0097500 [Buddleja alternifolia]